MNEFNFLICLKLLYINIVYSFIFSTTKQNTIIIYKIEAFLHLKKIQTFLYYSYQSTFINTEKLLQQN